MRIVLRDQPIFASSRFRLIPVDQDVLGLLRLLRHERPFHACWKSGAAAPTQIRGLYLINNLVRLHGHRLLRSLVAVKLKVATDISRALIEALRNDTHLLRMAEERGRGGDGLHS